MFWQQRYASPWGDTRETGQHVALLARQKVSQEADFDRISFVLPKVALHQLEVLWASQARVQPKELTEI